MKIRIEPQVFEKFHEEFMVGVISCSDISLKGNSSDLQEMLHDVEELIRVSFNPDTVANHQMVSAWKAAVAHFGEKATHYQTNAEKMIRTILEGKEVPHSDKLIDLCNFISLKYIIPLGVFDVQKVESPLFFTLAKGDETFSQKKEAIEPGELLLCDGEDVLARKLDYVQNPKAHVTVKTKNALITLEALPPINEDKLAAYVDELAGLIRIFCGGKFKKVILSKRKMSADM